MSAIPPDEARPVLTAAQWQRLIGYGTLEDAETGTVLFQAGDVCHDLIIVELGSVEVVREPTHDREEAVVATHGAGRFVGELSLLTGQATYLSARMKDAGRVGRIKPSDFRRLMGEDPELSDLILRALLARRSALRDNEGARSLEILGSNLSAGALAIRTYVARQQLPHIWVDIDTPAGGALARAVTAVPGELPVVITPTDVLRRATPAQLADHLGLAYRPKVGETIDLAVIGAGPAGLACAVYGASEGLNTVLLDAIAVGGQAAASSRIENYLGFTSGISGEELTTRAAVQAQKCGARIASPREVARLNLSGQEIQIELSDESTMTARAVVIATGARYRGLHLDRWAEFEGAGIFYAATELEARSCGNAAVAVVGGANSAGQAALYLAGRGGLVNLVIRGEDLAAGMSAYLADRILAHPSVSVHASTQVIALHGDEHLSSLTLRTVTNGVTSTAEQACQGLFCFIGATPATEWLEDISLDDHGFIMTDAQLSGRDDADVWARLGRGPLPYETSQPRVFAIGDVRAGSMKRVAAAVGEGASSVRSVHTVLGSAGV